MKDLETLVGQRIILRPFQDSDAELYSAWLSDSELSAQIGVEAMTPEEVIAYQRGLTENPDCIEYLIVLKETGQPIGDIDIKYEGQHNYGIMIADTEKRRFGYGREALELLFAQAKKRGIQEIRAEVFPENEVSIIFHESLSFEYSSTIIDDNGKECRVYIKRL